jgi:hypothetical protein
LASTLNSELRTILIFAAYGKEETDSDEWNQAHRVFFISGIISELFVIMYACRRSMSVISWLQICIL